MRNHCWRPWLVRHRAWSLTRFAIGADEQTAFKRQRGKDYLGETACFGGAICYRIPLRIQTKMKPTLEADGVFVGKPDLSDEVIVGTQGNRDDTIIQTNDGRSSVESRDSAHVRWSTVEPAWHHHCRTWRNSQTLQHESSGANAWSNRRVPCLSRRWTSPCAEVSKTGFEDIFDQEKHPGQPREMVQQDGPGHAAEQVVPGEPQQQHHASVPRAQCTATQFESRRANASQHDAASCKKPDDESEMRTVRSRLDMSALTNESCERDVPKIDWEMLALDDSSVYDIYTELKLDEEQVRAGRETEVQRMLEFEVWEEVNEEQACGKRIWNSAWLDSQKRPGLVMSRQWSIKSEVQASAKTYLRPHHHLQQCILFCPVLNRVVMAVASACGTCRCDSLPRND